MSEIEQVAWCPQCGPKPICDEDGCCAQCGADVGIIRDPAAIRRSALEEAAKVCDEFARGDGSPIARYAFRKAANRIRDLDKPQETRVLNDFERGGR